MKSDLARKLVNFFGMDAGWAACVLGAAAGAGWIGVAVVAALAALHFALNRGGMAEARLLAAVALMGFAVDTAMGAAGIYRYTGGGWICPPWLVALWVNLGLTLNCSLRFLAGRRALCVAIGLLGGPLAYYAGARLGALDFPRGTAAALIATAIAWAAIFPAMMLLRNRLVGDAIPPSPAR